MLPSFRLIATTFLCGFVLVYAGLRFVVPGVAHEPAVWPGEAVNLQRTGTGLAEWRQSELAVPVIFDLRFSDSMSGPAIISASLTHYAADRAAAMLPAQAPLPDLMSAIVPLDPVPPAEEGDNLMLAAVQTELPLATPEMAADPIVPPAPLLMPVDVSAEIEPEAVALAPAAAGSAIPRASTPRTRPANRTRRPAAAQPAAAPAQPTPPPQAQPAPTNPFEAIFGPTVPRQQNLRP